MIWNDKIATKPDIRPKANISVGSELWVADPFYTAVFQELLRMRLPKSQKPASAKDIDFVYGENRDL